MPVVNPFGEACMNIDKGPVHDWLRLADGTAYCKACGIRMTKEQVDESFPPPTQINKKAGGRAGKSEPAPDA